MSYPESRALSRKGQAQPYRLYRGTSSNLLPSYHSVKPSDHHPSHNGDAAFTSLAALGNDYLGGLTTTYVTWLP
jgi:hypothetical protein